MSFLTGSTRSWQPTTTVDSTTPSYWLNWRILLCSIWILMSMIFASILISKYEYRKNSEEQSTEDQQEEPSSVLYEDEIWKPCLRSIHPGWLLGFRLFAFFVLILMLILNVAVDGHSIFYFYTQWTVTLITIYFGLGSLLSMHGCYKYTRNGSSMSAPNLRATKGVVAVDQDHPLRQKSGFWGYAFQIIFQMNAGAVMLTDTVFWFIIVPFLATKDYKLNFLIINMHSINAIFLLVETSLNSLRFPWFRIGYFFLWTSFYVIFLWIVHARVALWWPYPFLDLSSSFAPLWYSTVALMHIPCYGIFILIMKAKHFLLSKWFPQSYRYAQ